MSTTTGWFTAARLLCATLLAALDARGSQVGDTYAKVMAEKGEPRSQMQAGAIRVLTYPDATIKLKDEVVVSVKAAAAAPVQGPQAATGAGQVAPAAVTIEQVKRKMKDALTRVNLIVNQPVDTVPLTPALRASVWSDGWFHPGAATPDFNTVDIRKTQETKQYADFPFISSNLNPGVAFRGADVEFNSMTKMFYVDRTLPKKRLTEEELVEINRLYRVIGNCERQLQLLGAQ
jgi:hypothetical protein